MTPVSPSPEPTPTEAVQVSPALPWGLTDGGTITLRDAITREQFLEGVLSIGVSSVNQTEIEAGFDVEDGQLYVVVAEGDLVTRVYAASLTPDGRHVNLLRLNAPRYTGASRIELATPVHEFEVYSDPDGTERPKVGRTYQTLYVKVNSDVAEEFSFGQPNEPFSSFYLENTGNSQFPWLYELYFGWRAERAVTAEDGLTLELTNENAAHEPISVPLQVSFGSVVTYEV